MPKLIGKPKPRFNLFDWRTPAETYIIMYYNYRPGKLLKYSVRCKVRPNDWDRIKQRARHSKRFPESTYVNSHLDNVERICGEIWDEYNRGNIEPAAFKRELKIRLGEEERQDDEEHRKPPKFLDFIVEYYEERAKAPDAKKGSLQVLHKVMLHVLAYAKERRPGLNYDDLNDKFYNDFRAWLHAAPRNLSTNYVQKIFENVKLFIRRAESRGYHFNRAYQDFRPPSAPITKISLSFDQLERLHKLDLASAPHLERIRDLFLIGAYTGLRYSDFLRIIPEHIQTHRESRVIEITTKKTNQTVYIPLHPVLDTVLKKYGYRSPSVSNQKMNEHLKELGKMAGLTEEKIVNDYTGGKRKEKRVPTWKLLTTHVARRSFATNFYQAYPEQIGRIMKITGHTTEVQFRAYIVTDALDSALDFGTAIARKPTV